MVIGLAGAYFFSAINITRFFNAINITRSQVGALLCLIARLVVIHFYQGDKLVKVSCKNTINILSRHIVAFKEATWVDEHMHFEAVHSELSINMVHCIFSSQFWFRASRTKMKF
jgi:hypothetical protein